MLPLQLKEFGGELLQLGIRRQSAVCLGPPLFAHGSGHRVVPDLGGLFQPVAGLLRAKGKGASRRLAGRL
jgi:hypothetical protein